MIPRPVFTKLWAQFTTPARIFQAALRPVMAATVIAGLTIAGSGKLLAQDVPPPPPDQQDQQQAPQDNQPLPQYGAPLPQDNQQAPNSYPDQQGNYPQQQAPAPQGQPLAADQLNQLVAPIALYPDPLIAQILAASTYPMQVVEADRWVQSQGNASADQIAAGANAQQWDPSVKALTAFPSVLSQMDRNLQWTTDLGNAYYNQPQDVMNAVQAMRQRAQQAGNLQSTPQQQVTTYDDQIAIAPANPEVVYVPVYNPWVIYGPPVVAFPGYYYAPPPRLFIGIGFGVHIGFGWGIPLHPWAPWGWGWHSWGCGWGNRTVVYNRTTYITRSTTVINNGWNRPGGPPLQLAGQRGSFMNRPAYASYANHVATGARPAPNGFENRPTNFNRPGTQPAYNHVQQPSYNRPAPTSGFVNGGRPNPTAPANTQRPTFTPAQPNRPNPGAFSYHPSEPQNSYHPAPQNSYHPSAPQNYSRPSAPSRPETPHQMSAPHSEPHSAPHSEPHGGGGGEHHH